MMFVVDFVRDLCRLPGQVKAINKKEGAVTSKNVMAWLILSLAGGLSCAFWSVLVGITFIIVGVVALMANRETAKFIAYVVKISAASVIAGGGGGALVALMLGGEISIASPWVAAPTFIAFLLCIFMWSEE